jgi:hypothetical protein
MAAVSLRIIALDLPGVAQKYCKSLGEAEEHVKAQRNHRAWWRDNWIDITIRELSFDVTKANIVSALNGQLAGLLTEVRRYGVTDTGKHYDLAEDNG